MKIISIEQYSCSQAPQGKALTVLKTENNWLWLTALVKKEGFQTPFFSLREIEISQKLSDLKLISQKTISVETGELFMSISVLNPLGVELTKGMNVHLDSEFVDDEE